MYYFVTQDPFVPDKSEEWPGQDGLAAIVSGPNGAVNPGLTDLLRNGNPVSITLRLETGDGHAVVLPELIQWGATTSALSSELLIYDNNTPLYRSAPSYAPLERMLFNGGTTHVTLDKVRLADGTAASLQGYSVLPDEKHFQFVPATGDSQHIYLMPSSAAHDMPPVPRTEEVRANPDPDANAEAVSAESVVDTGYLKVVAVGADSFKVYAGTTNVEVSLIANGTLDGTQGVYVHAPGDLVTELYLPVANGKLYRVELVKSSSLSRLKLYTSVPTNPLTLDKHGYEDLEMSPSDPTKAILYIGSTNANHNVTRISATNVQDQVGASFAVTVPIAPAKRRAVKH